MEIRHIREEEYEEAGELTALAYAEFGPATSADTDVREAEDWEAYFTALRDIGTRNDRAEVWVAVSDERQLLGTLTLELDQRSNDTARPLEPGEAYIRMLGIAPSARRLGAGRALMVHAIDRARTLGKTLMTLNTTDRMLPAQALYDSLGFVRIGEEQVEPGLCLLTYELQL